MKYSFIIPAYNNSALLQNTLVTLNHLTPLGRNDYEVIVIDDGSDKRMDETIKAIPKAYTLQYIYVPRTEDSSRAKARNVGIGKAIGEYVVFIDADIIVQSNFLEELDRYYAYEAELMIAGKRVLLQEPIEVSACDTAQIFDLDYLKGKGASPEFREDIFEDLSYNAASMRNPFLFCLTCNLTVPRKWVDQVGGFDEDLKKWGVEDIELAYRLYQAGLKVAFNYKNTVFHQFHGIKQGKFVKKAQEAEVDYNSAIFIAKHPGAMGLNPAELKQLFRSIATCYKPLERHFTDNVNSVIIHFREAHKLEQIKEIIAQLITMPNNHILIYDYVETTDLDIWIQLQAQEKSLIKYYPVSQSDYKY